MHAFLWPATWSVVSGHYPLQLTNVRCGEVGTSSKMSWMALTGRLSHALKRPGFTVRSKSHEASGGCVSPFVNARGR